MRPLHFQIPLHVVALWKSKWVPDLTPHGSHFLDPQLTSVHPLISHTHLPYMLLIDTL